MNLKFRKVLAFVMTLVLLLGNANIAFAEQVEDSEAQDEGSEIVVPQEESEVKEGFSQMYGQVYITGQKIWEDDNNSGGVRPDSITVNLLADGVVVASKEVTAANGWAWSFDISNGVPGTNANPVGVKFTVGENAVDKYILTGTVDPIVTFNDPAAGAGWDTVKPCSQLEITNRHDAKSIVVAKKGNTFLCWSMDPLAAFEREIIVASVAAATSFSSDISKYTFISGMGASSEFGMTVTETAVIFDSTSSWSWFAVGTYNRGSANSTASSLTNTLEGISVSGSKTWDDNDNQDGKRPESITINLLANGAKVDSKVVTEADGWSWNFENLPKYADGKEIVYTVTEDAVEGYTTVIDGFNVTNVHTPEKINVTVTKEWDDNNNQDGIRPDSITVQLLANGEIVAEAQLTAEGGWSYTFEDLDKYSAGEEIVYSVQEKAVPGYETSIEDLKITNTHVPQVISVSGAKTWNDNNNQDGIRPESITINLLADGVVIDTVTVTEADGWAWTFENLDKYRDQGVEIVYTVTEEAVAGYSAEYNGFNVTNTHIPEQTEVPVTKVWEDNNDQDGIRPNDITVKLLANGEDTGLTLILGAGNNWTGSFTGLDKYENGEIIAYTVEEVTVNGYETVVSGDQNSGYTITNTHTPETVKVEGSKTWVDNNNQDGFRPESITIHLLADGVVIDTVTVTEADGWAWSFENLPKYKDHGTLIVYSITEDVVEDYTTTYNGYNVTNAHTPEETSVTVIKAWDDSNNQDGIRPNDVTVKLLANGKDTGLTLVLNQGNNWTDTFTGLAKYENGEKIVYTVEEVKVEGYETVITGDQNTGYTVTNTHTPEVVEVAGAKTWIDNDNQDGFRPESITINLLADGEIIETIIVTAADEWSWSFENLPKYKNEGVEIVYTITENAVEDYSTTYDGYNVINEHTPEQTSVTVAKAWVDNDDQDGLRPDEITVILLADGVPTGETLVLNAENGWTGSFTELDKYADGLEIEYTIAEVSVEGYQTLIVGDMITGYVITNSHTPETISISGTKTWDDANDQDGVRPESITVNLLANGVVVNTVTVTEAENWSYSFENLPKYANGGVEIVYAITEEAVEGYTTTYDGYNITNSYTPSEISVTVTKAWADSDNEDGIRPDAVTITLYADGELTDRTLVLTAEGNWTGSFVGLPKYANGVEIVYTIGEVKVEGYNTVIRGDMVSGFVVTNSHTVIPQTGDERTPILWMVMMLSAMAVVAYVGVDSKKKRTSR